MMTPTPATEGVDPNGIVVGKWKMGLWNLCAVCIPNGFMATFCPGVSLAQICARLGLVKFHYVIAAWLLLWILAIVAAATDNGVVTTLCVIAAVLMALFVTRIRWRIRYLFSIPGSVIEDVMYSFLCGWCVIAQMATHVESYDAGTMAFAPRSTLNGYSFG
uniref:Transmembrane protein n=1 Tax=Globisporangium ultimum (strain ATCC 200006 / CBS 805.95 / DAOM BR144) TaxID=431595 RepID=K3W9N1_GLOUD